MSHEMNSDRRIAYGILRLTLGVNILLHGLVRLPHLGTFAEGMSKQFANTPLPQLLVRGFAMGLPFVEAGLGFLLILGLWTRFALIAGGCLILLLVLGTALRSDWETVGIQMLYAVIYFLLLAGRAHNRFSVDHIRRPGSENKVTKL